MNEYLAAAIDELVQLGVTEVVLSGGSRCTPLSLWCCEHPDINTYMHIDERAASFFALGLAKASQRPVAVICTSGSAGAHYLPAATEAMQSRVPLLFFTADRPPEARDVGAPQTIDQSRLLGQFCRSYEELAIMQTEEAPTPDSMAFSYPRMVVRKAYVKAMGTPRGPVQVNVPIREPLVPTLEARYFTYGRSETPFSVAHATMTPTVSLVSQLGKRCLIICGADTDLSYREELLEIAETLQIPVLADPLSNVRQYSSEVLIDSYDAFLKDPAVQEALEAEVIWLFGQPPVSKRLQRFLARHKTAQVYQIDTAMEYRNPAMTTTLYVQASGGAFMRAIKEQLQEMARTFVMTHPEEEWVVPTVPAYLQEWQNYQQRMRRQLNTVCDEAHLFEGRIIQEIQGAVSQDTAVVVSNSMAIRDVDYFWQANEGTARLFCNRGVNGIDGTISTALGVSAAMATPTVLVTGDLSFVHDSNGLLLGKTHAVPLVIVLFNNDGGGIFQYLPQKGQAHFSYLFDTPHGVQFDKLAEAFSAQYSCPTSYEAFHEALTKGLSSKGVHLIEIRTDKEESWQRHSLYTNLGQDRTEAP